ncbi:MAG: DUF222 domain-containing protein [Pseudonocardiaceae bacterium]
MAGREAAEIVRSALSPLAAPRPTTDTEIDLRDAAQRDADALVELAARALREGELPTEGGERPQVVVTVSLPVLQGRIGSASLGLGGPINADIARRIACDAEIIPVVLGSRGEPLDVGRASRTVPTSIRRIDMASGIPEFYPPPWLGGPPRRNPLHLVPDLIRIRQ